MPAFLLGIYLLYGDISVEMLIFTNILISWYTYLINSYGLSWTLMYWHIKNQDTTQEKH